MKTLLIRMLQLLIILLLLAVLLSTLALIQNKVPLNAEPGLITRLGIYLSQNHAQTQANARLPELELRTYQMPATQMLDEIINVLPRLGWELVGIDKDALTLHAVATTRWVKFKDDIELRFEPVSPKTTHLHIRSQSRIGRADYGANLGHILRFYRELYLAGFNELEQ